MTDYRPPFIPAADRGLSLRTLRDARDCVMRTWPRAVYEQRFHRIRPLRVLMVMDRDALHEIFVAQADAFPQSAIFRRILRPVWRDGMLTAEGEAWRWQRHAAAPAFTPAAAALVVPHAVANASALAHRWLSAGEATIDIVPGLADLATRVVFDTLLGGGDEEEVDAFLTEAAAMSAVIGRINLADLLALPDWTRRLFAPTLDAPAGALHAQVARLIAARGTDGYSGSLHDRLATAVDPETGRRMSADRLADNIVGSLSAARDTTSLTIAWAIHCVGSHRPTEERLIVEIDAVTKGAPVESAHLRALRFTRAILMETLRLFPPGPQLARDCIRDTEIAGERVRRGTTVVVPVYAIHRHRDHWDRPDIFDPDRFMDDRFDARAMRYSYLPFGAGPRICLGAAFAMAEAQTVVATLFQALRFEPRESRPIEFNSAVLRSRHGLPMRVVAA